MASDDATQPVTGNDVANVGTQYSIRFDFTCAVVQCVV